jgi:hypothetical protein
MNSQVFIDYTGRFEQIMQSFPRGSWKSRLDLNSEPAESSDELSLSALKYLNLCAEEYYLYRKGYLDKNVWKIWESELKRTLQSPLFKREWIILVTEFESYPEFQKFVSEVQSS